jgi:hypothetical protein
MSGSKPGERRGGRQKGTPNKRTAALKAATKAAVEQAVGALPEPFEGDGYAFLATVYKDTRQPIGVRLDAAKTAVAYERARLASVEMTTRSLDQMSDEEFFRAFDSMTAFLEQHGRPQLLESAEASPDAAGRDTTATCEK